MSFDAFQHAEKGASRGWVVMSGVGEDIGGYAKDVQSAQGRKRKHK